MSTYRIAVINHDPPFIRLVSTLLNSEGYHAESARWSGEALDLIRSMAPDLAIIDVWLEEPLAGWKVVQQVRRDDLLHKLPIILTSRDPLALTELQGELDTQTVPLTKPLDLDTLLNAVNTMLRVQ